VYETEEEEEEEEEEVGRGMPPLGVTILCHARVMSDSQAPPTQSREL